MDYEYKIINSNYVLHKNGKPYGKPLKEISICFYYDKEDGTVLLLKHGSEETTSMYFDKHFFTYRDSGLIEQGVRDLEVITGEFNVDDINKIIHNTGYLSVFLIKHNIINLY